MGLSEEQAFTLTETLISLVITLLILTLSFPIFHSLQTRTYDVELATLQFFTFIQDEVNAARGTTATPTTLLITDPDNRTILIEPYHDMIRRRVDGSGHEVLLQEVVSFEIIMKPSSYLLTLHMKDGDTYQRQIHLPLTY